MKNKIKILFVILALSAAQIPYTAHAQTSPYYTFSWNIVFPTGDFGKWVDQTSLTGFDFGAQYYVSEGLTAGFNIGSMRVNALHEDQTFTIPDKGVAITADNYRITWMIPFQATIAYHLISDRIASPYFSLGIGGDYMTHHLLIQEYDIAEYMWDFSLTPEFGVMTRFGRDSSTKLLIAFNYKWTTNKINIYETVSENLSMFNLKVGIVIN